jgi:hypothetical protein
VCGDRGDVDVVVPLTLGGHSMEKSHGCDLHVVSTVPGTFVSSTYLGLPRPPHTPPLTGSQPSGLDTLGALIENGVFSVAVVTLSIGGFVGTHSNFGPLS